VKLTASIADRREWCNWCPDLIMPGEVQATSPRLKNPFGEPGFGHADCAVRNGYGVIGEAEPTAPNAIVRRSIRGSGASADAVQIVVDFGEPDGAS
jgi:hypothetical protein